MLRLRERLAFLRLGIEAPRSMNIVREELCVGDTEVVVDGKNSGEAITIGT